jgi:hypothetical protein
MRATGAAVLTGAGSPNGVVTTAAYGDLYRDTSNGALYVYLGDTDAPWLCLGGDVDPSNITDNGYPVGVSRSGLADMRLLGGAGKRALVSDAAAQSNTGNGLYWNRNRSADGAQILDVNTGSTGQFTTRIDVNGHLRPSTLVLTNHAAPADADLAAGDCALWFDQTNGAAKLMIKAKTADGTVVTGAVNLT